MQGQKFFFFVKFCQNVLSSRALEPRVLHDSGRNRHLLREISFTSNRPMEIFWALLIRWHQSSWYFNSTINSLKFSPPVNCTAEMITIRFFEFTKNGTNTKHLRKMETDSYKYSILPYEPWRLKLAMELCLWCYHQRSTTTKIPFLNRL